MSASTRVTRSAAAAAKASGGSAAAAAPATAKPKAAAAPRGHKAPASAAPAQTLEFVTLTERDHKEHETMHRFVQWNGNEKGLRQLQRSIAMQPEGGRWLGEICTFTLDLEKKLTEDVVDNIVANAPDTNDCGALYTKVTGVFHMPKELLQEPADSDHSESDSAASGEWEPDEAAKTSTEMLGLLNDYLRYEHLMTLFTKPGEPAPPMPESRRMHHFGASYRDRY